MCGYTRDEYRWLIIFTEIITIFKSIITTLYSCLDSINSLRVGVLDFMDEIRVWRLPQEWNLLRIRRIRNGSICEEIVSEQRAPLWRAWKSPGTDWSPFDDSISEITREFSAMLSPLHERRSHRAQIFSYINTHLTKAHLYLFIYQSHFMKEWKQTKPWVQRNISFIYNNIVNIHIFI